MRECLKDRLVEREIARLEASELVALAKQEERIRYQRQQYLRTLQALEKKGKAMAAAGLTIELLRETEELYL